MANGGEDKSPLDGLLGAKPETSKSEGVSPLDGLLADPSADPSLKKKVSSQQSTIPQNIGQPSGLDTGGFKSADGEPESVEKNKPIPLRVPSPEDFAKSIGGELDKAPYNRRFAVVDGRLTEKLAADPRLQREFEDEQNMLLAGRLEETKNSLRSLSKENARNPLPDPQESVESIIASGKLDQDINNQLRSFAEKEDEKQKIFRSQNVSELLRQDKAEDQVLSDFSKKATELGFATPVGHDENIEKSFSDYNAHLSLYNPDLLKEVNEDINSGNQSEQEAFNYFSNALNHQYSALLANLDDYMMETYGVELTDKNIVTQINKHPEDENIQKLVLAYDSMRESSLNYMEKNYPNAIDDLEERAKIQDEVDKDYAEAKRISEKEGVFSDDIFSLSTMLRDAKLLRHEVGVPILNRVNKSVKGFLSSTRLLGAGEGDFAQSARAFANSVDELYEGVILPEARAITQTPLIEEDKESPTGYRINDSVLLPKTVDAMTSTLMMLAGGRVIGGGISKLGFSANLSQNLGLMTSSFALTNSDYYEQGRDAGLTREQASEFAVTSALTTSLLETISPNRVIFGGKVRTKMVKDAVGKIKNGVSMKEVVKENTLALTKEIGKENLQEMSQLLADKGVQYIFDNSVLDREAFSPDITPEEVLETMLITTLNTGIISAKGTMRSKSDIEKQLNFYAGENLASFKQKVAQSMAQGSITDKEAKDIVKDAETYSKIIEGLPENLEYMQKVDLTDAIFRKKTFDAKGKDAIVDDVVKRRENVKKEVVSKEIEDILDGKEVVEESAVEPPTYKINGKEFSQEDFMEEISKPEVEEAITSGETKLEVTNDKATQEVIDEKFVVEEPVVGEGKAVKAPETTKPVEKPAAKKVEPAKEEVVSKEEPLKKTPEIKPEKVETKLKQDEKQEKAEKTQEAKTVLKQEPLKVDRKERGKAKVSEALDEIATILGSIKKVVPTQGNPLKDNNALNSVKKLADGLMDIGVANAQDLIAKLKTALKGRISPKHIDEFAKEFESTFKSRTKDLLQEDEKDKIRGFQETLEKQAVIGSSDAKKRVAEVVKDNRERFKQLSIEKTIDQAEKNLKGRGGFEASFASLVDQKTAVGDLAVRQAERMVALFHYGDMLDKAIEVGNTEQQDIAYSRIDALQRAISQSATMAGQANAVLMAWRAMRPDGTVEFTQRKIDEFNDNKLKKKRGKDSKSFQEGIDEFKGNIENLTDEQIEDILTSERFKDVVEKTFGKRKSSTAKTRSEARKVKIDTAVDNLEKLKIKPDRALALPPGINLLPGVWNTAISTIQGSLKAGNSIATAIDAAIEYINGRNPQNFDENNFKKQIKDLVGIEIDSVEDISKEVTEALDELEVKLKDVIKSHYSQKSRIEKSLVDKIVKETAINQDEAERIAQMVKDEFQSRMKSLAEKELAKTIGTSKIPIPSKSRKTFVDNLLEKVNLGALDSRFYSDLFSEHLGFAKPLTEDQQKQLKKLVLDAEAMPAGSLLEREATLKMVRFIDEMFPGTDYFDTWISLYYSSILSGFTTHALNLMSAGSNIVSKPLRNALNISRWINAVREGVKAKDLNEFLTYSPIADIIYMPIAASAGMGKGLAEAKKIWRDGDFDNKFMETVRSHKNSSGLISPLERSKNSKRRIPLLQPLNIKIPGTGKSIDINPFNYYKFVGRALSAEDRAMFYTSYDMEMAGLIRAKFVEEGLRGKALRKAVFDELNNNNVDFDQVDAQLKEEQELFERRTGDSLSKEDIKIRRNEIISERFDSDMKLSAERLGRSNIFTDDRGGMIAMMAKGISWAINRHPIATALLKPIVPFTKVVGNVAEYMMDATPIYGQMRAHGWTPSNLIAHNSSVFKGSQLGPVGSPEYYEQMGRAWLGTAAFIATAMLFLGTDEDDEVQITGGYLPEGFKGLSRENVMPKYSVRIGKGKNRMVFSYLNLLPSMAVPLGFIGNYNDRLTIGQLNENEIDRMSMAYLNTVFMVKDQSFLSGVQNLFDMIRDVNEVASSRGKFKPGKFETVSQNFLKTYLGAAAKPLPQNFNLIKQMEKVLDPESFSQKDVSEIMAYQLGISQITGQNKSLDIFGDPIKYFPGETLMPYTHWEALGGKKGTDPRWKFLVKHDAIPTTITRRDAFLYFDKDAEYRRMTTDELFEFTQKVGKMFDDRLKSYMEIDPELIQERSEQTKVNKRTGITETAVQKDISKMWSASKKNIKRAMFDN